MEPISDFAVAVNDGSFRLISFDHEINEQCEICSNCISSQVCYRVGRSMYIHENCVKFPKEITHPFHPHHPLNLEKLHLNHQCSVCNRGIAYNCYGNSYDYAYNCSDICGYYLDVNCASLTPVKDHQNLCNLPDSLIPYRGPKYLQYSCNVCNELIEGDVYFDSESKCLLHESCYKLPEEINHPFHPSHPLTLFQSNSMMDDTWTMDGTWTMGYCYVCKKGERKSRAAACYRCSKCRFYLDVHCAFLAPTNNYESSKYHDCESRHGVRAEQTGLIHQHPWIECSLSRSVRILCSACQNPCKGLVYVCIDCHLVVEESCLILPRQIQHPLLHPQHPLTLYQPSKRPFFGCNACYNFERLGYFIYACLVCCVQIDVKCAWSVFPSVNSHYHQHPLVFLDKSYGKFIDCAHCHKRVKARLLFCLQCEYHLHLHCLPELPRVVKHESHMHPLSLADYSRVKDDLDKGAEQAMLYCNVCGVTTERPDLTYYCADCHFVAHIYCLIPQILQQLQISSVENQDAANVTILDGDSSEDPVAEGQHLIAELKSEIASIDEERRELRYRRAEKNDHAAFIASMLHLPYDSTY